MFRVIMGANKHVILRNVTDESGVFTDLAIQYEEVLTENGVDFEPIVTKTGDLSEFFGHKEFNLQGMDVVINNQKNVVLLRKIKQIKVDGEDFLKKIIN